MFETPKGRWELPIIDSMINGFDTDELQDAFEQPFESECARR